MPYKSKAQQAYMHIHEPKVAKKWDKEMKEKGEPFPKQEHVAAKKNIPKGVTKNPGKSAGMKKGTHSPEQQEYGPPSKPLKNEPPMDKVGQLRAATDAIHREHLKRNGCPT